VHDIISMMTPLCQVKSPGSESASTAYLQGYEKDGKKDGMKMSCAVLAGGLSTRMGTDKALVHRNDKPLIESVVGVAKGVFDDVFIISSRHGSDKWMGLTVVPDVIDVRSPLVGIASALLCSDSPFVFVLACDMLFVTEESVRHVVTHVGQEDIVVPRGVTGYEPLHAVYGRACLAPALSLIEKRHYKIRDLYAFVKVRELGEHPVFQNGTRSVFSNINTMDDLRAAGGT